MRFRFLPRYAAALLLAVAAQLSRLPLHPPTLIPNITYVPFILLSAAYGGFGPGLLTTALCVLESLYFAIEPTLSFQVHDPRQLEGLAALLFTGVVISLLFEQVRKARQADESARDLRALLEQTYDAVSMWELPGGKIQFWNRAAERVYGFSGPEAQGQSIHDLLTTVFPVSVAACETAIRESGCWEGELFHTSRDGRQVVVESRMAARRLENGGVQVIEITRDIGERKRLEAIQARLAQQQRDRFGMLESIFQHSPACFAILRGPEFTFESVNPAYADLCPGETLLGRTVAEVWPDAAPIVLPLLQNVRETLSVYRATEARIPKRSPQGPMEDRFFDFSYIPLFGSDDDVRIMVAAVEVTPYKRSEEQLRAANHELDAIYENTPVALLVLDQDLQVRKLNDMAKTFSVDPEGNRSIGTVIGCLNAAAAPGGCGHSPSCPNCALRLAALDSLQNGTRKANLEAWMPFSVQGRSESRCLLISLAPVPNGSPKLLVCTHDITERKRAEESLHRTVAELESALSQKTALLQEVHHRVKNNLAVISSLLGMKADAVEDREARLALEESQRRVLSIALIHEHLYASVRPDRVDFLEYARQLVQTLHSAQADDPARIALRLELAPIEIDIQRAVPCALILSELVTNALKHAFPAGRSGEIRISFQEREPDSFELVIADDGIGTPPGAMDRNTKSLGLKIVKILCRQLEGTIAQPAAVTGTSFVLRFPKSPLR